MKQLSALPQSAQFLGGWRDLRKLPEDETTEIALIGRSNVGKSTLINRLTNQKSLAKTSRVPGKTTELNLYQIVFPKRADREDIRLVDLPGVGFAELPKQQRQELEELIQSYITHRQNLKVVVIIVDGRREVRAEERLLRDLAAEVGCHVLIVANKADLMKKNEIKTQKPVIAKGFALEPSDIIWSGEGIKTNEIWERIAVLIDSD
jgi:GTP-binding protein